jgi:DNA topoisomerase-1
VTVSIHAADYIFTASGSTVKFPGFMKLYMSVDEKIQRESDRKKPVLPELTEGTKLKLNQLEPKQHFTMPPPRFSEASLVKELEENGIGRPSTYAAILSTIRQKEYVNLINRYFRPTELGYIVNDLLVENFPDIFSVEFTARLEENLDRVESAEVQSAELLSRFYDPFKDEIEAAAEGMLSVKGVGVATELNCPECGKQLHIKVGKNGHFLACSGYPECSYSRDYERDEKGKIQAIESAVNETTDKLCAKCGNPMVVKRGRYGEFLACSGYPECQYTQSLNSNGSAKPIGVKCPQNGCGGEIVERQSKRGKLFFGCNKFPDCNFATWDKPIEKECPSCSARILVEKTTKKEGKVQSCLEEGCGYRESA